ncbi:hypothetical protein EMCRGX_G005124 [Ephydatia muelleri]
MHIAYWSSKMVWVSFLDPSHLFEREMIQNFILTGGKVGIHRNSLDHQLDDFALVRPTIVSSTPRFWNLVYNQYLDVLSQEHKLYLKSLKDRLQEGQDPAIANIPQAPNVSLDCFCERYGASEVGDIATGGNVFADTTVKLIDVPEMGYLTSDNPPRGEICVQSIAMVDGYFKNDAETADKFDDGYFRTGDIGVMEKVGKITVIDRKKNIFKLAQGEFVSPERLENMYTSSSHLIEQVYFYGNSLQMNVVAVVIPHKDGLMERLSTSNGHLVYCLVRNTNGSSSEERMQSVLTELSQHICLQQLSNKVVVVKGDLSRPNLDLHGDDYKMICNSVDVIIHNGAVVNAALPYEALKSSNVESTKEIIAMSRKGRSKFIHYVSTVGVFAPEILSDPISEESDPSPQDRLCELSGYSQSPNGLLISWFYLQLKTVLSKETFPGNLSHWL